MRGEEGEGEKGEIKRLGEGEIERKGEREREIEGGGGGWGSF